MEWSGELSYGSDLSWESAAEMGKMKPSLDIDTDGLEMEFPLAQEAPSSPIKWGQILPGSWHSLGSCSQPGSQPLAQGAGCSRAQLSQDWHFRSTNSSSTSLHSSSAAPCAQLGKGKLWGMRKRLRDSIFNKGGWFAATEERFGKFFHLSHYPKLLHAASDTSCDP